MHTDPEQGGAVRPQALAEALGAMAALAAALGAVRGRALSPGSRPEDRLDGLGALAAELQGWPWREALAQAAVAGDTPRARELWGRFTSQCPQAARTSAVIFRGWGLAMARRGEHDEASFWLTRGLALIDEALASSPGLAQELADGEPGTLGDGELEALRAGVAAWWQAEHAALAAEAIEAHDWALAELHWRLARRPAGDKAPEVVAGRRACVEGLLARAVGLDRAAAARGVGSGAMNSLRLLLLGLSLEPDAWSLHREVVALGARAGLEAWGAGALEALDEVLGLVAPSLRVADRRVEALREAPALREQVAEVHVLCAAATDHPSVAVAHLRRATSLLPTHPTARALLSRALAALAARLMGAGRVGEARQAAQEAASLAPRRWPELTRLLGLLMAGERGEGADEPL